MTLRSSIPPPELDSLQEMSPLAQAIDDLFADPNSRQRRSNCPRAESRSPCASSHAAPTANSSSGIRGLSRFVHPGFNSAQHDGSHVSLLRYVQFPVQSAKFPVSILIRKERFEFVREWKGCIARISLKRQKFPVFSRETGNTEAETGSPMTASTARKPRDRRG